MSSAGIRRVLLATRDADGLYEQFGFVELTGPTLWMSLELGGVPDAG